MVKKRNENVKNTNFMMNNNKMLKEHLKIKNSILYSELVPLTRDVTCSKLSRKGKNISDKKLSEEHTLNFYS